jgi:hypothetical protein
MTPRLTRLIPPVAAVTASAATIWGAIAAGVHFEAADWIVLGVGTVTILAGVWVIVGHYHRKLVAERMAAVRSAAFGDTITVLAAGVAAEMHAATADGAPAASSLSPAASAPPPPRPSPGPAGATAARTQPSDPRSGGDLSGLRPGTRRPRQPGPR